MKGSNPGRWRCAGLAFTFAATLAHASSGSQGTTLPAVSQPGDSTEIRQSIKNYQEMVRQQPNSAEAWSNLGAFHAMAGECTEALPALARAETLNGKLFNPWFFSGYCQFALHRSRQADESLRRALRLNPRDANAWSLKAQVDNDLGEFADSLDDLVHAKALAAVEVSRGDGGKKPEIAGAEDPQSCYLAGKNALELATQFYDRVMDPTPQPNIQSLVLDGERNAALAGWELALNKYQRALRMDATRADVHFALGSSYLESGSFQEAESSFRRCLKLAPDSTWARLRLVLSLLEQSKQEEAQRLFRMIDPGKLELPAEVEDYLGCAYLLKLPEAARPALEQAEKKFPYLPSWSEWRSRLAPGQNGASDTASAWKPAGLIGVGLSFRFFLTSKLAPGNVFAGLFTSPALYQSFRSEYFSGDWMRATGAILPLVRSEKPGAAAARAFALGEILHSLSVEFHTQLGSLFPDSVPAMKLAAENLSAMGEKQKAMEIYQGLLQRDGPSPDILGEVAHIYWSDHKWEEALGVLKPLSEMDPNDATIFVNMGRIYAYQQKSDDAASAFEQAIRLAPDLSEAHLGLGQILRGQGELERALAELRTASRLDPLNPRPHYVISQIYSRLGDKNLATQEMATFQRLGTMAKTEARERNRLLVPLE